MIWDFIVIVLYNALGLIFNQIARLDDVSLPNALQTALDDISPYYTSIDVIFPMGTALDILFFELIVVGGYFSYKLVRWGYRKIPGIT